jgi:hypothetical protein
MIRLYQNRRGMTSGERRIDVPRRWFRRRLHQVMTTALAMTAAPLLAADAPPVLLVVPAGADVAGVEAVRASVPSSRAVLTVGATERVALRGGIELVADRTFADAPRADLVLVLAGEASGEEEFLAACRRTAKAILFLGDSPLLRRLKGDGSRGALILVGGPEAVGALAGAGTGVTPSVSPSSETNRAVETATPKRASAGQTSRTPGESAVHRYFSAKTPTPTPKS